MTADPAELNGLLAHCTGTPDDTPRLVLADWLEEHDDFRAEFVRAAVAYDRTPLKPVHSLVELWGMTKKDLDKVTQPLLVFHSVEDHVVEPSNTAYVLAHVGSADLEDRALPDSYHVATLDNDAQAIFDGSLEFVRRLAPAATEV